jgi:glycosyltransferase involved in cell wall biosynthesis
VPLAYNSGIVDIGIEERCDVPGHGLLSILTVGHVNANKRVGSVIRAIGSSRLLRDRVVYRLVGSIQSNVVHELSALARKSGVRLRIAGEVDEAELAIAFQSADIVCCLRWPSLEAASASAIEAMLYGKAIIVTDTGFYRELPNDCVTKVDPLDEAVSLREALENLAGDDELRSTLGERSRAWAAETFTAKNYAEQIIAIADEASRIRPVLDAIDHLRRVMVSWGGDDASVDPMLKSLNLSQYSVPMLSMERSA